jgi:hypothetical protein
LSAAIGEKNAVRSASLHLTAEPPSSIFRCFRSPNQQTGNVFWKNICPWKKSLDHDIHFLSHWRARKQEQNYRNYSLRGRAPFFIAIFIYLWLYIYHGHFSTSSSSTTSSTTSGFGQAIEDG